MDCDSEWDESDPIVSPTEATRGLFLTEILCGHSITNYAEFDLLANVPVALRDRSLATLPEVELEDTKAALSSVPSGMYLITGAPGRGKSVKLVLSAASPGLCRKWLEWHIDRHAASSRRRMCSETRQRCAGCRTVRHRHHRPHLSTYTQRTDAMACQRLVCGGDCGPARHACASLIL